MFTPVDSSLSLEKINQHTTKFLESYYHLNTNMEEGLAIRFKFNNNWLGIPEFQRIIFDNMARELLSNPGKYKNLPVKNLLNIVDTLVIASNHLDQQTSTEKNPKPASPQLKKEAVLRWLMAAKQVLPEYSKTLLNNDAESIRLLSSMAQLHTFLGKALRYNSEITLQYRAEVLMIGVEIARYLNDNVFSEYDPHAYKGRLGNNLLPMIYTLRQLKKPLEALALADESFNQAIKEHDDYSQISPITQKALIYKEMFENEGQDAFIQEAIKYAQQANNLSNKLGNAITKFNALVTLMECFDVSKDKEETLRIANLIIEDGKQENSGAKPFHIQSAESVIEKYTAATNIFSA